MEGWRALRRASLRAVVCGSLLTPLALVIAAPATPSALAAVADGALSQLPSPAECVGEREGGVAPCGTKAPNGLSLASEVQVNPDDLGEKPSVSDVNPDEGSEAGGTEVTIKGAGFVEGAKVSFGAKEASGVTIKSGAELTAITPAEARGSVNVTVTTTEGTSEVSPADNYVFVPPHQVGGLDVAAYCEGLGDEGDGTGPTSFLRGELEGPEYAYHNWACVTDDGEQVEIKETGPAPSFEDMCAVQFAEDSSFAYPSNPNNAYSWDCYALAPKVTSVKPTAINVGGGSVTIRGENLKGASAVSFGGESGSITPISADEATAEAPAHPEGIVEVIVTTPGGESATSSGDKLQYVAGPSINRVEPQAGPEGGGTKVKILGEFLEGGTVAFGGRPAKILTESADKLEVETPAHAPGTVEVEFEGPAGEASGGPANGFTYEAPPTPTVTAITPDEGPIAGGPSVKITGTNFTSSSEVKFGANASEHVEYKNSGELVAKIPAGSGTVDVRVKTAGGTSATGPADEFTYRGEPTVTAITPNEGPIAGGPTVKITGTNFTSSSEVKFGTNASEHVEFKNSGELVAKIPAGSGTVNVTVKTAGGTSTTGPCRTNSPIELFPPSARSAPTKAPSRAARRSRSPAPTSRARAKSSSAQTHPNTSNSRTRANSSRRSPRGPGPSTSSSRPPAAPRRPACRTNSPIELFPPSARSAPTKAPSRAARRSRSPAPTSRARAKSSSAQTRPNRRRIQELGRTRGEDPRGVGHGGRTGQDGRRYIGDQRSG